MQSKGKLHLRFMKNESGVCRYKTRCCNASMYWVVSGCTYAVSKVFYIYMCLLGYCRWSAPRRRGQSERVLAISFLTPLFPSCPPWVPLLWLSSQSLILVCISQVLHVLSLLLLKTMPSNGLFAFRVCPSRIIELLTSQVSSDVQILYNNKPL